MKESEKRIDAKLVLSILAAGIMSFSGVVVETAMNVTFPTLMKEFGIGTSTVQWITTGYLLVLAIIIPASSYLKKRFKMKALFVTAVCLFILGTVMAAAAPVFPVLLGGRLIQGVGTGIALPMMFNIVLEQVPENRLGLMMGIATLITAIAPAVGPSLGGVIVSYFGWRMIFVALLPLLILSFLFGVTSMRQVTETGRVSFQIIDYLLLATGFACFIFATSMASEAGWTSVRVIVHFLVSVLAIVVFYRRSIHSQSPLIDVKVFHSVTFTLSVIILLLIQFICLGLGYLIPNYSQIVSGEEALIAGCLLLPGCILGACIAPVSGRLLDRFGAKRPILTGVAAIMISLFCFSFFATRLTTALFIAFYLIFTFGQGFSTGNTMTNGLRQLPENLNADGNAVFTTLQQLAGAIGTSVVSTIVASAQAARPDDMALATMEGSRNAFYLLAVLAVAMMCCACGVFFGKKSRI
ncbi:MAG TPA: DHA2 family efflux MFS transporter permease subunit [Candidatus Mediterraneibacter norfolkensis]|nr:DHA2 family efflux MFS transporter permease subunit [Candidatus Mediterraneibacter norfolkensis]